MKNKSLSKRVRFSFLVWLGLISFLVTGCEEVIIPIEGSKDVRTVTEVRLFDYRETELDNGMKVITLEDFSCPIVAFQVWYHVGSKDEDPQRQGFAHMFEHMMFKGTDHVGEQDHFNFIQMVGGTNNAYTGFDKTVYLQTLPANQLELAFWLEAERMAFLKIDQDAFDTERNVVEEELRMGENRPYGTLFKKQLAELFKVHPYRWTPIGKLAHIRSASVPELRDFWTRNYVPNNATVIIVGAVKHLEALKLAEKYFGWIKAWDEPKRVTVREPKLEKARTVIIDDENAPAGGVDIVYRTVPAGHKDEITLDLLASILGGGNSSRFYRELVAEKQLAVSANSYTYNMQHDGFFLAGAMHEVSKDPNAIIDIIQKHIEKAASDGVTESELEKVKNQMLKSLVTGNLTISRKARLLGEAAVIIGDTSSINTKIDRIKSVTTEDIRAAAKKYLVDNPGTTFIVKPNTKGALAGKKDDETTLVTAQREETAPPPGRKGVSRPKTFPQKAPFGRLKTSRFTPGYSTTTLDNGLKVIVVPNREVPFVSIKLGLLNGSWTEDKPGTASMAMNMLTKGTAKHSEGELAEELERYAISLRGSAGMDTSQVQANCLIEHVDRAMELLTEVVLEPVFDENEFEKLRKQVITGLSIEEKSPDYLADKELRQRIYGEHPYARTVTGQVSDVMALQVKDLKLWWKKFARPDMATLIFAGDIKEKKAVLLAQWLLGKWETTSPEPKIKLTEFPQSQDTHIYIVDQPGTMQTQIRIGQLGITRHDQPDYFISRVVSNYFGWAFNSRLNEIIRVKKGLTYGAHGSYNAQNLGGEFVVSTFTKTDSTAETIITAIGEIKRLQTEGPTGKELNDSKSYFAGSFVRNRETPQQVARDLWLIESQNLGTDYLDRLLSQIANTTDSDCRELAQNTINSDKMVIVVVGDASKIAEEMERIAPVTIITKQKD